MDKRQRDEEAEAEEHEEEGELRRGTNRGRPKGKRTTEVRYGEEERREPQRVEERARVYDLHKVKGRWIIYVETVEEAIVQQDRTGHETQAPIM